MKRTIIVSALVLLGAFCSNAQDRLYSNEFPIGDVTLLDGPFKHARDLNLEVLLQYDVDRLLAPFRAEAGLPKKAEYYPNWAGLDGHIAGHYLTAMAMNWQMTGNPECLRRMNYMIDELAEVAAANTRDNASWGAGYIGGIPNSASMWSDFMRACVMPGSIAEMKRRSSSSSASATGPSSSRKTSRMTRWSRCSAMSMAV